MSKDNSVELVEAWESRYNDSGNRQATSGYRRSFIHGFNRRYLATLVARLGVRGDAVDIGCGSGRYAALLDQLGFHVTGVDYSAALIEQAAADFESRNITWRVGSFDELPIESGSIDLALSMGVLQHVADLDRALFETRRVLRSGGRLLFEVRNRESLMRITQIAFAGSEYRIRDREVRNFSYRGLRRELAAAGFADVRFHNCFAFPPPLGAIGSALHRGRLGQCLDHAFPLLRFLSHNIWFSAVRQ